MSVISEAPAVRFDFGRLSPDSQNPNAFELNGQGRFKGSG